jgi:hypothetical protein
VNASLDLTQDFIASRRFCLGFAVCNVFCIAGHIQVPHPEPIIGYYQYNADEERRTCLPGPVKDRLPPEDSSCCPLTSHYISSSTFQVLYTSQLPLKLILMVFKSLALLTHNVNSKIPSTKHQETQWSVSCHRYHGNDRNDGAIVFGGKAANVCDASELYICNIHRNIWRIRWSPPLAKHV